jgi:dethiobiotin synthase
VSAALLVHLRARLSAAGETSNVRYWKPVQTGIEQDDDTREVGRLGTCSAGDLVAEGVRLERPLSPHLAARLAGRTISIGDLLPISRASQASDVWVVEGAGGVFVPLNDSEMMLDLMSALDLPVVVAARSGLGTINHALLTVTAIASRGLRVAGVVMVGEPNAENRKAIETYGRVPVLGEMPRFDPLTPEALGGWARSGLDRDGRLEGLVRA